METSPAGATDGGAERPDLQRKLAEANLMRVRCRWIDAEGKCVEVLRADPNDINAHSLLGDIYRDQGRLDDARQWYQMVLDLCPGSQADREKLARVEQALREAELRGGAAGSRPRRMITPTVVLRVATGVVLAFLFFAGAAAMYLGSSRRVPPRPAHRATPVQRLTSAQPSPSAVAPIVPSVPSVDWEDRWARESSLRDRMVGVIPAGTAMVSGVSVSGLPACAEVELIWVAQADAPGTQAAMEHCVLLAGRAILADLPEARGVVVRVGWLGNRGVEPLVVALATRGGEGDLSPVVLGPVRWLGTLPEATQPGSPAAPSATAPQGAPPGAR